MPKGKKICPKCNAENGVRTSICACGHEFVKFSMAVPATEKMTIEPIDKQINESISNLKSLVGKVASNTPRLQPVAVNQDTEDLEVADNRPEAVGHAVTRQFGEMGASGLTVYAPAGDCPFKPEGFKGKDWPNGPASPEVIQNWAVRVFNSGTDAVRYHPHAVVYWARFFWEMQALEIINGEKVVGREWDRVKTLIEDVLKPRNSRFSEED